MCGYYAHDLGRGRSRAGTSRRKHEREKERGFERLDSIIERSIQGCAVPPAVARGSPGCSSGTCVNEEDFNFTTG